MSFEWNNLYNTVLVNSIINLVLGEGVHLTAQPLKTSTHKLSTVFCMWRVDVLSTEQPLKNGVSKLHLTLVTLVFEGTHSRVLLSKGGH